MRDDDSKSSTDEAKDTQHVNDLISRWCSGDENALGQLLHILSPELKKIARRHYSRLHSVTLNPSDLLQDFDVNLLKRKEKAVIHGRKHFLGLASTAMGRIVIDHARRRQRRPSSDIRTELEKIKNDFEIPDDGPGLNLEEILAMKEALIKLDELDQRQAIIAWHTYYGALTIQEVADLLDISIAAVKRDLQKAKAFLTVTLEKK